MFVVGELLTLIIRACLAVIIGCVAYAYVKMLKNPDFTSKIVFWV